ncbi:MAG: hypothetical protein O7J95_00645, partial [Planctomycetota bacterium]|nr:hypothetical protein [Planctomycetota bacterium]
GIFAAAYNAANISIDHHSYALLEIMQGSLAMTRRAQKAIDEVQKLLNRFAQDPPVLPKILRTRIYLVEINFEQVTSRKRRERLLDLPTSFALEPDQVDDLVRVAGDLLDSNSEFQRFLHELPERGSSGENQGGGVLGNRVWRKVERVQGSREGE